MSASGKVPAPSSINNHKGDSQRHCGPQPLHCPSIPGRLDFPSVSPCPASISAASKITSEGSIHYVLAHPADRRRQSSDGHPSWGPADCDFGTWRWREKSRKSVWSLGMRGSEGNRGRECWIYSDRRWRCGVLVVMGSASALVGKGALWIGQ